MPKIFRNPVPTAGEVRIAWSRGGQALRPALHYLRVGAYFGLGLGFAGLGIRSLRTTSGGHQGGGAAPAGITERGEATASKIRSNPVVSRVAEEVGGVTETLGPKAEAVLDEVHDSIEEIYGRYHLWLRNLPPATSRR